MRTPVCIYCGSPNPRPLTDDEWAQLVDRHRQGRRLGEHVVTALADRVRLEAAARYGDSLLVLAARRAELAAAADPNNRRL